MACELNITYTNDYGLHKTGCDHGAFVCANFPNSIDVINYIYNAIHEAYHVGGQLYDDTNVCEHGYSVEYIIMEIVKYNTVSDEDPDDEEGPLVLIFDIYNHKKNV